MVTVWKARICLSSQCAAGHSLRSLWFMASPAQAKDCPGGTVPTKGSTRVVRQGLGGGLLPVAAPGPVIPRRPGDRWGALDLARGAGRGIG